VNEKIKRFFFDKTKMKILLLADPASSHSVKWINSLHKRGFDLLVFGLSQAENSALSNEIKTEAWKIPERLTTLSDGNILKSLYLLSFRKLQRAIKNFKPDLIHAHYASSYGLLGALSGFTPFLISVWGNDVFDFPLKSVLHKKILEFTLSKASLILSTSKTMANETAKYTSAQIEVVPFGVDTNIFKPATAKSIFNENDFVIGTVKSLYPKYGIEYLIRAFKLLKEQYPDLPLKLLIVGEGLLEHSLKKLTRELGIHQDTVFTGKVNHSEISSYYNMMQICIFPSVHESFGVAVIEALACEKPVVATNVGGFAEIISNNKTGLLTDPRSPESIAGAVSYLINNPAMGKNLAKAGREDVLKRFEWESCVNTMEEIYKQFIITR
jgi:glycosyltransferase involved in cell wall biosynthesis